MTELPVNFGYRNKIIYVNSKPLSDLDIEKRY